MVIQKDDAYILYYSISSSGSQNSAIGYATSSSLEGGTWVDMGETGVRSTSDSPYNTIDPTMILVDGTYHLSFGSYWNDIYQVKFDSSGTAVTDLDSASQTIYDPVGGHPAEGSFPFEYNNYFYMFWSEGQANNLDTSKPAAGEEYKVRACRSSAIAGPYVDQ